MSKPFDATLNSLIDDHRQEWAAFLASRCGVPPGPAEAVDTDLSTTLQADRLFRIDGPEPAVIHLELESTGRLGIPAELLRYNVAAHGALVLPVATVLLLLRPKATATDLTGTHELRLPAGPYLTFRYTVIRLWQEPMAGLLAAGPGLAPLALLTNEAAADLPAAFGRLDERLARPDVTPRVREKVFGAAQVLGGLRYDTERLLEYLMSLDEIVKDSVTYQWLRSRGQTVEDAGAILAAAFDEARVRRQVLLEQGTIRFGPPDEATVAAIQVVFDPRRLRRLGERLLTATGWDDLLATP